MDTRINSFYEEKLHPFVAAMTSVLTECESRVVVPPWLLRLRRGANQKFDKDIQRLHEIAAEVVARRRAKPTKKKDLLNAMLHGIDPVTGEQLNDQTITDNMITFLIAGKLYGLVSA
jgi:cytochrome P450/NADPH-cytochrome P450 reductase